MLSNTLFFIALKARKSHFITITSDVMNMYCAVHKVNPPLHCAYITIINPQNMRVLASYRSVTGLKDHCLFQSGGFGLYYSPEFYLILLMLKN